MGGSQGDFELLLYGHAPRGRSKCWLGGSKRCVQLKGAPAQRSRQALRSLHPRTVTFGVVVLSGRARGLRGRCALTVQSSGPRSAAAYFKR